MTGAGAAIQVFLCDDVPELRTLLRYALEDEAGVRVVGEAGEPVEGIRLIAELRPDVVLLDLSMPGMDGLEALPKIREIAPDVGIIVFSGFAAERLAATALSRGADAYLEKGESMAVVRRTVREVAEARRRSGAA
jgi:DNA-binding NarL/FixJ family response regulator